MFSKAISATNKTKQVVVAFCITVYSGWEIIRPTWQQWQRRCNNHATYTVFSLHHRNPRKKLLIMQPTKRRKKGLSRNNNKVLGLVTRCPLTGDQPYKRQAPTRNPSLASSGSGAVTTTPLPQNTIPCFCCIAGWKLFQFFFSL